MPAKDPNYMRHYMRHYRADRRQPPDERQCETCHKYFTPQRSDARYCSDSCRAKARRRRVTITEWLLNPTGWLTPGPPPRPAICSTVVSGSGCQATATWCRQSFNHATRHLVGTEFLCEKHHKEAKAAEWRAATTEYREHKQKTQPAWLEGKSSRWSRAARDEAMAWWLKERHGVVKVLPELVAPHAVLETHA